MTTMVTPPQMNLTTPPPMIDFNPTCCHHNQRKCSTSLGSDEDFSYHNLFPSKLSRGVINDGTPCRYNCSHIESPPTHLWVKLLLRWGVDIGGDRGITRGMGGISSWAGGRGSIYGLHIHNSVIVVGGIFGGGLGDTYCSESMLPQHPPLVLFQRNVQGCCHHYLLLCKEGRELYVPIMSRALIDAFHDIFPGFSFRGDLILGKLQNIFRAFPAQPVQRCISASLFNTNMPSAI